MKTETQQSNHLRRDSREVQPGDIFLAMPGLMVDGRQYIDRALANGASKIYYEARASEQFKLPDTTIPLIPITDLASQEGYIAADFYGHPARQLAMIGVTGTNGKTSITHYLAQCLHDTAVVGTLGYGSLAHVQPTGFTTPQPAQLQHILRQLCDTGIKTVAMEVSSHALALQRVNGIDFKIAIFSNLSHDHLDFHGDLQNYMYAKQKLFRWPSLQQAVINIDDPMGKEFVNCCLPGCEVITYSVTQAATIRATHIRAIAHGFECHLATPWGSAEATIPLLGRFNIENCLAVIGVLGSLGLSLSEIVDRLAAIKTPVGRMQLYQKPGKPVVAVDFAHTPAALEHVLTALREHCHGKLYTIMGCGGDRDVTKRQPMGEIASRLSDYVVITNDNPRHEAPESIAAMIRAGVATDKLFAVILDRKAAIEQTIATANVNDLVLVAGKGHENYQLIGDQKLDFSDGVVVSEALNLEIQDKE